MTIEEIDRKAAEMIQKYRKATGSHADEFVFNVEYRHHSGEFYTGSYEPCSYDENSEKVDWYNDWWEGEQDVVFVRVVSLYEIINFYFERMADPTKYEVTCLECRYFENCVDAKRKEGEEFYCYTYEPKCRYLVKAKKYKAGEGPELKLKFLDREDGKP